MSNYNKQVATELYEELRNAMKGIPDQIAKAEDGGVVMKTICDGLSKAITALKTTVR